MGSYVPSTKGQREEMLSALGLKDMRELYSDVPESVYLKNPPALPAGLSEMETAREMKAIAGKNRVFSLILRGAGAYDHYIPAIVRSVTGKEEFLTAYTPYQAEISQGILQSIFEFQTMICELTGMDAANASVYDGASAAAEAAAMCRERARTRCLISGAMHPDTIATVKTYCHGANVKCDIVPVKDGRTDEDALKAMLSADAACVIFQQPNFFGVLEDGQKLCDIAHAGGAKAVASVNPISLGLLTPPAEYGADIAVGEGQPLGMPLAFGGPYLGFMATKTAMIRRLPGRIVGETRDARGERAYVLTLQAREQHIRREKASSNICSNEALCALTAGVYLSAMGPEGLKNVARQCYDKAHYFADGLQKLGFTLKYSAPFFHEFMTDCPVNSLEEKLAERDILCGLPYEGGMLWCVTEKTQKSDLDAALALIKEAMA